MDVRKGDFIMNAINTTKLTKTYGKARGITNVDLTVKKGEFFGFIGPNGAGKSTTIRTLLGLIRPDSGKAEIFGKNILSDRQNILSTIGYLPSEVMFYSGMRVKDVIKLSADMRKKKCDDEAKKLCERLALDTNKKVEELSLGNRKKVAIVCAMQHKPDLYIMDEATSGLDPLMQREFFLLLEERNSQGATIFLSSHVLSEIQRHCNRAAIIREGKIIACDTVESLSKAYAKRVTINGLDSFPEIDGVRDFQHSADSISFLYSGNINALMKEISKYKIGDLTIAEPDLEEIFMHFYSEKGE